MPGYWNLKSDLEVKHEITNQLSIKSLDFIGRYVKHTNGFTFFDNIRLPNFSPLPKIKSNKDDKLANAKIIVHKEHSKELKNGSYYHFTSKVIPQNQRVKHNNEFLFTVENDSEITEYKPIAQKFIDSIYERFDKADSANNNDISKALNTITYQINKKPETFIYELLQNADDNAVKDVNVTFYITEKYLLVFHNGEPFKFNNVFAICSVNAEDKSDDIDKIGFKGIGFKSVFKDNDWVFINSGEYSFRFDQSKYSVEKPWQLMPIWTPIDEDLEKSLRNNERFLSENVSIALLPKDNDTKLLSKYSKTLELFNDDRILLFLKKVKKVHVSLQNKEKIDCRKNNAIWGIGDYTITVKREIKNWLNEQIRNNNQEVPIKYQDIDKFKISYAYKLENRKVTPLVDSTLFNYLPLSISLCFPFLVNSDFIPDGDREELYLNAWNEYLMIEIGRNLPIFISDIVKQKVDSFHLLPESAKNNFLNSKWNQLYEWFLQGYVESLKGDNPIAFIPSKSGSLETLSNILIDETGLTELLGDTFSQLTGISEKLIDRKVGEGVNKIKALLKEYDLSNNIYTAEKLKADLENDIFQKWLKNPINNFNFLKFVFSSTNAELKAIVDTEKIILTEAGELSKAEDTYSSIPNEISFISNNRLNLQLKEYLDKSTVKLRTIEFCATNYLISNREKVNTLLSKEIDILNFWCFVYDHWKELKESDDVKKSLRKFHVICKPTKEGVLITKEISATYLSKEIAVEDEVESIIESLKLKDKFFINPIFINNGNRRNITTWLEIFKGAKRGLSDLINELIFQLEELKDDTLHFKACNEIFKYWNKKNKNQQEMQLSVEQIAKLKQYLKIKCIDDEYRASSESIISEHYQTNKIIDSILLEISLSNQISSDYSDTQIIEWNTFFKEIGCISLEEKQKVFDAKLSHFIKIQDEFQGNHLEFMKELYSLYNGRSNNSLDFDFVNTLSKIKLKTSNENWQLPDSIHLSSVFCNASDLDLQIDLQIEGVDFLSSGYKKEEFNRDFFKKLGVKSGFEFQVIETVAFDKFPDQEFALSLMHSNEFEKRRASLLTRYKQADINKYSKVTNYVKFYCLDLAANQKYNSKFIDFIKKNKQSSLFQKSSLLNNNTSYCTTDNNFVSFIKNHEIVSNRKDELKKPINLISLNYEDYVSCSSFLPKDDFRNFNQIEGANLEELLGIQQLLNESHCIEILSRTENKITPEKIVELDIVKILKGCRPSDDVRSKLFFLNEALDWKPINELFFSYDSNLVINPEQHLNKIFLEIAKDFGINELSEANLELKTVPEYPPLNNDIQDFYLNKAKFIAFKIDQVNWGEIESNIIEHLSTFKFYEVELVAKVFLKDETFYEQNLDFYFDEGKKEIIYKGYWKNNKSVLGLLHNQINSEKIENVWFDNIINRWNDRKIIETLLDMFGFVPDTWVTDNEEDETKSQKDVDYIDPFWSALTYSDIEFIREIIEGEYELDEQMDSNLAAKIKTLMIIRSDYSQTEISDKGYFLRAGLDDIIVRSAQRGLLFLDLYHWKRLGEKNVKLAIHTNNQITLFQTQQDLFDFAKPLNKYGMMKLPVKYSLDDLNSIGKKTENGKWHYVFIVNSNTIFAKSYIKAMEYSDPDLFKEDNF